MKSGLRAQLGLWLLLCGLVLAPNLYFAAQPSYFGDAFDRIQLLLFAASTWLAMSAFFPGLWVLIVLAPALLMIPAALLHLRLLGAPIAPGSILSAFHSTPKESWDLIAANPGLFAGAWLLAAAGFALCFFIQKKRLWLTWKIRLALLAGTSSAYVLWSWPLDAHRLSFSLLGNPAWSVQCLIGNRSGNSRGELYPLGALVRVGMVARDSQRLAAWKKVRLSVAWEAAQTPPRAEREVHVLYLGESVRRDHWQIYGYARETSPRLAAEDGLVLFTDVVATANFTSASVLQMLTRADASDISRAYREPSLVTAFRKAGFESWWLSNSAVMDTISTPITMLAEEADHKEFTLIDNGKVLDGTLLERLDRALAAPGAKKWIVLHGQGSHFDYRDRYDRAFDRFQPSYFGAELGSWMDMGQRERLVNTYDNTLLYTDHLLGEVIARLKKEDGLASLTFVSDHGERLMDHGQSGVLHSSLEGSRAEAEVPLIFWFNPAFAALESSAVETLKSNSHRPLSARLLFDTMLGLGRIELKDHEVRYDAFRGPLAPMKRELVLPSGHIVDYEQKLQNTAH